MSDILIAAAMERRIFNQMVEDSILAETVKQGTDGKNLIYAGELPQGDGHFPALMFRAVNPVQWYPLGMNLSEYQFSGTYLILAVDQQDSGPIDFTTIDPAAQRIHDLFHAVTVEADGYQSVGYCEPTTRGRSSLEVGEKIVQSGWVVRFTGTRSGPFITDN